MIPYGRQVISEEDIHAVTNVLRSDFLTQGPAVPAFENAVADYCSARFAIAANSATSALHLACLALEVGSGDIVWTSAITFVASANCALYCGAGIDFVDIDPRTYNMGVESLAIKLMDAEKSGKLPKVVIPVHLCGQSCDMAAIHALSQKYNFRIIEDASHAMGGKYRDDHIGNCRYSDIGIFSFHPVKIITSGEGGIAVTNDAHLAKRMKLLRSHGVSNDPDDMLPRTAGEVWAYQQFDLGFNYRMTDIHAALGLSQLTRLDAFVAARHAIANRYDQLLANLPITLPWRHPDCYSAFHLYVIRLHSQGIRKTHRQIFDALRGVGIGVNLHYIPVYRQPYYEKLGFQTGYCPKAECYFAQAISLPIYPLLTAEQQDQVIEALIEELV